MSNTEEVILAKLVRGKDYTLSDKRFEVGEEIEVTQAEREHLEEHAVDAITMYDPEAERGLECKLMQKFEFRTSQAPGEEAA